MENHWMKCSTRAGGFCLYRRGFNRRVSVFCPLFATFIYKYDFYELKVMTFMN